MEQQIKVLHEVRMTMEEEPNLPSLQSLSSCGATH